MRALPVVPHPKAIALVFGLLIALSVAVPTLAQNGYPLRSDRVLNDYARALTSDEVAQVHSAAAESQSVHGVDLAVLTVNSIRDYATNDSSIESFATHVFNTWGVGNSQINRGILVVVAVGDRTVRIELGRGYGSSYDAQMKDVIDRSMLPFFREGAYGRGIVSGVDNINKVLAGDSITAADTSGWGGSGVANAGGASAWPWWVAGLVGTAGAGTAGVAGYQRFQRNPLRRTCPACRARMQRLDSASGKAHLSHGQQTEANLGSVDYDVWLCRSCQRADVEARPALLSGLRNCPRCSYKTLSSTSKTIRSASYSSAGLREITSRCNSCSYTNSRQEPIPILTVSSSTSDSSSSWSSSSDSSSSWSSSSDSSSDSSSGGSSSGDGASGSW